ncbi:glutamic acid-rich protein-like [Saccostrea echinata]|uniref:glutamic acid-rich protein-like n=1 Tax=Saccostrea echinata TaxID=191078 RepID=UPI002A81959E|nr:glutamic acid-rich protein-like [Saccostrea echinata]
MSAPRPQSSRGRGRGRHGGQGVNNSSLVKETTRDQSPKENDNVSPAGVNRQRKKKPEVQRYVPRGRRLLNQQDEEARLEQNQNRSSPPLSSRGSNSPIGKDYSTSSHPENIADQSLRSSNKGKKNNVDISPGRSQEEQDNQKCMGDFNREVSQGEVSNVSATETTVSLEQVDIPSKESIEHFLDNRMVNNCVFVEHESMDSSKGTQKENKEISQIDVQSHSNCDISESRGEEECMDVKVEEEKDFNYNLDQDKRIECDGETLKEKIGENVNMAESESNVQNVLEKEEGATLMETNTQDGNVDDGEDDIPLNWDDDVEEINENVGSKNTSEQKRENQDEDNNERKVKAQESEGKTEVKKIKLKKMKKKSKTSGETKVEEETPSVEKKGKKKSTRTNITVFDMMNMHELKEDKREEKKVEVKEKLVPEVDAEEIVPKGDNSDKEADEDDGDWDTMFNDDGECLDPSAMEELTKTVGKVQIEKATINYLDFKPKEPDYDEMNHVIEIFDFPAEFKTEDLLSIFSQFKSKGFDIKWVDDTHALGVFSSVIAAQDALKIVHPLCKVGPLSEASKACKAKAKRCVEFLQPYKPRPETTAMTARRLVTGALGLAPKISKEQRELERKKLKEAKEKKRSDRKQREDMWEGTISNNS